MIYLDLFLGFLQVGCFSFGGAYFAIPLIRDVVLSYGWLDEEMIAYMVAVSESTPGPIMVNMATYVGSSQAGLIGAAIATFAVVLPSFIVILLIAALLNNALKNKYFQAVLRGMKPSIIGIILATGLYFTAVNIIPQQPGAGLNLPMLLITALTLAAMLGYKKIKQKKLSPIQIILILALLGLVIH